MSYFMRYILTRDDLSLSDLDTALRQIDPQFAIQIDQSAADTGDLYYGEDVYGELSVNRAGDLVFKEDLDELRDVLKDIDDPLKGHVLSALDSARTMVALHVLQAGDENPDILDQLWDWLFDHFAGLLQVDDEGYYNRDSLVLPTMSGEDG